MTLAVERNPIFAVLATDNLTIDEVASYINQQLRGTALEPEWLHAVNFLNDPNEARYGPVSTAAWPNVDARGRLAVSVRRGRSEGWLVHVDWIRHLGEIPNRTIGAQKLLVGKTFVLDQAWAVARSITTMLDIA